MNHQGSESTFIESSDWRERTTLLLGPRATETIQNARGLILGVGGVGGFVAEFLARMGVGSLTLIDPDTVQPGNRNRQVQALSSTEGLLKVEVLAERLREIHPEIQLKLYKELYGDSNASLFFEKDNFDFAVDAIDTIHPKALFISQCLSRSIPLVSSLGSGGKLNPALVQSAPIENTYNCRLGSYLRKKLHRMGIYSGFTAVFSPEPVHPSTVLPVSSPGRASTNGTVSYMPAVFASHIAHNVLEILLPNRNL